MHFVFKRARIVLLTVGLGVVIAPLIAQQSGPSMMEIMFALQEAFDKDPKARVDAETLGIPSERLARIDADGDGSISFAELSLRNH